MTVATPITNRNALDANTGAHGHPNFERGIMSTPLLKAFEARRKAEEALKGLYDSLEDGVSMTAEQVDQESRMASDIEAATRRETNLANMAKSDADAAEARAALPAEINAPAGKAAPGKYAGFRSAIKGGPAAFEAGYEERVLNKTTATDGPELVETELLKEIHDLMVEESPIMSLAKILRTAGGNPLLLPRVTTHSAVALVAESAAVADGQDPQFDQVTLGAFKFGGLLKVASELEQDAAFPIGAFVTEEGARSLGRGLGAEFVSGAGSTRPTGVDTCTTGVTTAATAAVTLDELITLQHSVLPSQRNRGSWLFSDATIQAIRKLKDGDGNYMWQPSVQAGVASTLFGRPVYSDPNLANMAAEAVFGVFGDFSGFVIRMAGGITIDRSAEAFFVNDQVAYRFIARVDSKIVDTTGLRKIVNAAS